MSSSFFCVKVNLAIRTMTTKERLPSVQRRAVGCERSTIGLRAERGRDLSPGPLKGGAEGSAATSDHSPGG